MGGFIFRKEAAVVGLWQKFNLLVWEPLWTKTNFDWRTLKFPNRDACHAA